MKKHLDWVAAWAVTLSASVFKAIGGIAAGTLRAVAGITAATLRHLWERWWSMMGNWIAWMTMGTIAVSVFVVAHGMGSAGVSKVREALKDERARTAELRVQLGNAQINEAAARRVAKDLSDRLKKAEEAQPQAPVKPATLARAPRKTPAQPKPAAFWGPFGS